MLQFGDIAHFAETDAGGSAITPRAGKSQRHLRGPDLPATGREQDFGRTMKFAREFKTARHRLGLSQDQAARKWKVPLKALQNWEQGVRTPRAETLLRLFTILFPDGFGKTVFAARRRRQSGSLRKHATAASARRTKPAVVTRQRRKGS